MGSPFSDGAPEEDGSGAGLERGVLPLPVRAPLSARAAPWNLGPDLGPGAARHVQRSDPVFFASLVQHRPLMAAIGHGAQTYLHLEGPVSIP